MYIYIYIICIYVYEIKWVRLPKKGAGIVISYKNRGTEIFEKENYFPY